MHPARAEKSESLNCTDGAHRLSSGWRFLHPSSPASGHAATEVFARYKERRTKTRAREAVGLEHILRKIYFHPARARVHVK